ncbi:hypothetical protein V3391_06480 [Luteimonas sp. SMYT11W]|uniref:Uncharacterized protein n=1 Tax=Luteimonas flava TaxID=3115822 RepID=A0ABU7WDA5_9GAMM
MADPATNTTFPAEFDPLPAIGPNDKQNDPTIEHDAVHDRAHAVLNALQQLIGFGDEPAADSVLGMIAALASSAGPAAAHVVPDAGVSYACAASDAGQYRVLTAAGAKTITVQEPLPEDFEIHFDNRGGGAATVSGAGGAVVTPSYGGTLVLPQHGVATLKRLAANDYRLTGALEAAA